MRKWVVFGVIICCVLVTQKVIATPYGVSQYGGCAYGDGCYISIATNPSISLNITPRTSGVYTIAKDEVTVTTNVSTGYELWMWGEDHGSPKVSLAKDGLPSATISGVDSASPFVPTELTMNTWGYRIDGLGAFGAGPTSAVENQSTNSLSFAYVPSDIDTNLGPITSTNTSAPSGNTTTIWYGAYVDISKPAGNYTAALTYTAIAL